MRNPIMLLTLLAASGGVILAAALQRRKSRSTPRDADVKTGDRTAVGEDISEGRRGDRPEPPAPPAEPAPDNLEPFSSPGSVDERR